MSLDEIRTSNPNQWQQAARLSYRFRDRYPVLRTTDDVHLAQLAAQEVQEAQDEQNYLESSLLMAFFDKASDHAKEFADILVFLFSYTQHKQLQPQFEAAWQRANGQGAKSPIYDQLHEQALNLNEGDVDANVMQFLTYVISLSNHLPYPLSIIEAMQATLRKNRANRPEEYYQARGVDGQQLSPDEIQAKYQHTERALRLLRNHFGSPLQTWMHEYHRDLILDFTHSEANLVLIQDRLAEQEQIMAVGLLQSLHQSPVAQPTDFSVMLRQLEIAGGVPLYSDQKVA